MSKVPRNNEKGDSVDESITVRRLCPGDAEALCSFYNGLSPESIRTFRPLGAETTIEACRNTVADNGPERDAKLDIVAWKAGAVIGWCFIWKLETAKPLFGLGVADEQQGQGIGTALARHVMALAAEREIDCIHLTVVKDNLRARAIYKRVGFVAYGEFTDDTDALPYVRMKAER